jgi:hypothetical protein
MADLAQLGDLNTLATHGALSAWTWASDFLIVIVLVGFFFLFAYYVGKGPFIGLMISFYAGYALYQAFPYMEYLPTAPAIAKLGATLGIYLVLLAISYFILRRTVVSDFVYVGIFGMAILSFLGAGLVLALAYHIFPVRDVYTFTPALDVLFAPKQFFFYWFAAPLIGLFIFAK